MTDHAVSAEAVGDQIQRAVKLLEAGELVAIPTETVYGLGADASNSIALAKIFAAKGRPADHPLIVHIADASHLGDWAREIPAAAHKLAAAFWPGPLTLILKRQRGENAVPDLVTGGQDTVGVRVPNHPVALQLLGALHSAGIKGIAAPSANRFGRISPTTAQHVRDELGEAVALVLDGGPCAVGIESTIVDLSRGAPVILRPGMIGADEIARVLDDSHAPGLDRRSNADANPTPSALIAPRVSGSLEAHYAPTTPMRLVLGADMAHQVQRALDAGQHVAVLAAHVPVAHQRMVWRQAPSQADQYAHDLYANLRTLDAAGSDLILVETPPQTAAWLAIHDRLARAARGAGH